METTASKTDRPDAALPLTDFGVQEAKGKIGHHFLNTACFRPPFHRGCGRDDCSCSVCNPATSAAEMMQVINGAVQVLSLLEEFPILASQKFSFMLRDQHFTGEAFPLAFFVWNGFDQPILERVLDLYPEAINETFPIWTNLKWSNLLHYACVHLCQNVGDHQDDIHETVRDAHDTLIWLATCVNDTFDTSQALFSYLDKFPEDEIWDPVDWDDSKELLEILLAKDPQIGGNYQFYQGQLSLLDLLAAVQCDKLLFKKALDRVPEQYRVLNLSCNLWHLVYGDRDDRDWVEDFHMPRNQIPFFMEEIIPEVTDLTFELLCIEDASASDYARVLEAISRCSKLQKLTIKVPTQFVHTNKGALDSLPPLQQMSAMTNCQVSIQLYEGLPAVNCFNCFTGPTDAMMGKVNDECIQCLINGWKEVLGLTLLLPKIELHKLHTPHYELVAELCLYASTLRLVGIQLASYSSRPLCELWNKSCSNEEPCCHSYGKALRVLASLCHRNKLSIKDATIQSLVPRERMICLEQVWLETVDGGTSQCADITQALISLLRLGTIKNLQLSTSGSTGGRSLDLSKFCEVAKDNDQLESLEIYGVTFIGNRGRSEMECFFDMVQESTTKKLSFLLLANTEHYRFINTGDLYKKLGKKPYIDSYQSHKIQFLLLLNKYGLAGIRGASASRDTLVKHLEDVQSANVGTLVKKVNPHCLLEDSEGKLTVSIMYGLLREAPHLWSSTQGPQTLGGLKRRVGSPKLARPSSRQRHNN